MLHLTAVRHLGAHRLWVQFDDGAQGVVDLAEALWGPVFEPLQDPAYFALVTLDAELGTVVWPNGADLAPEALRELLSVATNP